jgi:hypothetical protein
MAYADNVPSALREGSSLIVIGKASDVPFLADFNNQLPAPFDTVTNTASERNMQIVYRVPSGVSIGYLQLLVSPFNLDKVILVASANNDAGLPMAGSTLTDGVLQSKLAGQFAVTNGIQVATGSVNSTQFSIVGTVVPDAERVVATPVSNINLSQPGIERPTWLNSLPIASAVVIVLVLAYVGVVAAMRRRQPKGEDKPTQPRE